MTRAGQGMRVLWVMAGAAAALFAMAIALAGSGSQADAAGGRYACDLDPSQVVQRKGVLYAGARAGCTGPVAQQSLKVCILQQKPLGSFRTVKCGVRTRGGPGFFYFKITRRCAFSQENDFAVRAVLKIRLSGGDTDQLKLDSNINGLPRDC